MGIILTNGDSFTYGDELEGSRSPDGNDTHHHHTFTYKLASRLDRKYVNLGQNGCSNMKIYRRTLDFLMTDPRADDIDLMVITWSNWGRFELCENLHLTEDKRGFIGREANMNQVIPDHHSTKFGFRNLTHENEQPERYKVIRDYIEGALTYQTQIYHGICFMTHIQWLCDKLGIPIIQGCIHGDGYKNFLWSLKQKNGWEQYIREVTKKYHYLRPECKIGLGGANESGQKYLDIYTMGRRNNDDIKPGGHAGEDSHTLYTEQLIDIIKEKELLDVTD